MRGQRGCSEKWVRRVASFLGATVPPATWLYVLGAYGINVVDAANLLCSLP